MTGNAKVFGHGKCFGNSRLSGNAIVCDEGGIAGEDSFGAGIVITGNTTSGTSEYKE